MKREAYHPCLQANRDDKILFYPTEEKPIENYPPPFRPNFAVKINLSPEAT